MQCQYPSGPYHYSTISKSFSFQKYAMKKKLQNQTWKLNTYKKFGSCLFDMQKCSKLSLTLWTLRAGIAANTNGEPKPLQACIPAFAMVCHKPKENVNRLT